MKVVCVDAVPPAHFHLGAFTFPNGRIVEGETYTVTGTHQATVPTRHMIYTLAEKPFFHADGRGGLCGWACFRFVPLHYFKAEFELKETEPAFCTR